MNPWAQLGVTGIICAVLSLIAWTLWQDNKALRSQCSACQETRIADRDAWAQRDNERAERIIPLLSQAADALKLTPELFDRALGQARSGSSSSEVERLVRRMEQVIDRAGEK